MNYKELFKRTMMLISSPVKAWEEILLEKDKRKVLGSFVYPMIGLCGFSVFLGTMFEMGLTPLGFQFAMSRCCAVFVGLFGGYFLSSYLINELNNRFFRVGGDIALVRQFVGYSMVVSFVLTIIDGVFPDFLILRWILQFYVLFVVWEGVRVLLRVDEQKQLTYTVTASLLIILCPALLGFIFTKLTLILN